MSSIQHRTTSTGEERWRVMWRSAGSQQARTFTDETDARKWRVLLDALGEERALAALADGAAPTETRTVAEQVAAHVDGLTGITEGTRRVYRSHLERVIAPTPLGSVPLSMLRRDDIAAWVNDLDAKGAAAKTIRNYHGLLSAALGAATRDGLMPSNPAYKMRLPRGDHLAVERAFLTPAQLAQLHDAMTPYYRPLILLLVGTGMRFGEATALRWRDVDLEHRTIRITRAWQYTGKAARKIGSPKTTRSTRTVRVPPNVIPVLAALPRGKADDYLLTAPRGGPIKQSVFYPHWRKAAMTLDLTPPPRIHDLRHTFASWAIQDGNSLPVIQRQLGHESVETTSNVYGHLAPSDFDALAQATSVRMAGIVPGALPVSGLG